MFKNKFFTAVVIAAAACTVSTANAQSQKDLEMLKNPAYQTYNELKKTQTLGMTLTDWLKREDKTTGDVQRWELWNKRNSGPAITFGIDGYVYDRVVTPLPMIGFAYVGPYVIPEAEVGIGRSEYKDPASDKFGESYYSVVARADLLWKFWRSSFEDQLLEKWYLAAGPGVEYNNRRNSFAETTETSTSLTVTQDKVQGSSYGVFGKLEFGYNLPKLGLTLAVNGTFGVGRDYRLDGTIDCTRYSVGVKMRWVPSKKKFTKLGLLQKNDPEKFNRLLRAYDANN
jgi:hypothetical protein